MVNPIKTPQEILLEQAGIPRMAGGGGLSAGAKHLFESAVKKFRTMTGRAPNQQELQAIEAQALKFSAPTSGLRSGMSAPARASHELNTTLREEDMFGADPFLTQAMLGRTPKGTWAKPKPMDITNPQVGQRIEAKQLSGELADDLPNVESITPTADYLARQSKSIENALLEGGALDKLKTGFYKQNGRYPNEDELNALVADWNAARHQYSAQGISVIGERPPTAKGMADWRAKAREAGVQESAINKPPADYPAYLKEELSLQRGELPTTAVKEKKAKVRPDVEPISTYVDENGQTINVYPGKKTGGYISPDMMRAELTAHGKPVKKFKGGGDTTTVLNIGRNVGPDVGALTDEQIRSVLTKQFGPNAVRGIQAAQSATEPTAVVKLAHPATMNMRQAIGDVARATGQSAVAGYTPSLKAGYLEGPNAAQWGGKFMKKDFIPYKGPIGQATSYLGKNPFTALALGVDVPTALYNTATGRYGEAAGNVADMVGNLLPGTMAPILYQAGQELGNIATEQLARNPVQRKQMQSMASTPLGGALAGDTGLAAAIMGDRDYGDVLAERNAEAIAEEQRALEEQQKAYKKRLRALSPVVRKDVDDYGFPIR